MQVATPVSEVGLPQPKPERSQSMQCTSGESMEEEAKLFTHGAILFSAENSYSLDSGLQKLTRESSLEEFRKEVGSSTSDKQCHSFW